MMIDHQNVEVSLKLQAELLSLSRASLYYMPVPPTPEELYVKRRIDEIYTARPFYGSRKILVELRKELVINRKTVQRHMRDMGLAAIVPGPHLSQPAPEHHVFPYLLRGLKLTGPNHVWGIDITYIRLRAGWLYLVAVLDWYSRYVLSWELDQTLEMPFVLSTVQRALTMATPTICNSDQGSHFTSPHYLDLLQAAHVQISMDGRGRALDNIFTERLWRTVKYEEVYLHEYDSPREARQGLTRYFQFYNDERSHQALAYRTPAQAYFADPATPVGTPAVEKWTTGTAPVAHFSTAPTTTVWIPDSTKGNRTLAQPIFVS
jgi:putative transposase